MDITRNGQTVSFIMTLGELMQVTPYVSKAGEPEQKPQDPAQVLADAAANMLLGATGAMDEMAAALAAFNASRRPA